MRGFIGALAAVVAILPAVAAASPITIIPGSEHNFRDTRGVNDVGISAGDRIQFGANLRPNSAGSTITGSQDGFKVGPYLCQSFTVNRGFCGVSRSFHPALTGAWELTFRNGADTATATTPALGVTAPVPFPTNVSISGSGFTPTFNFVVPAGFGPDGIRVNIFDKSPAATLPDGEQDIIHSVGLASTARSYTIPVALSSGQTLKEGNPYSVAIQLVETRGHVAFTNDNAQILRRSSSYFDFAPLGAGAPPNVFLPTVDPSGKFYFFVQVSKNVPVFVDPLVAIGYDFQTGAGNPNFGSVMLPSVGDNQFDLWLFDAQDRPFDSGINLIAGTTFDFTTDLAAFGIGADGIDRFRILGIEPSAGLNPADGTAFVTGLTFVADGNFTGTMTPITQSAPDLVPEPATLFLLGSGLAFVAGMRRRPGTSSG